MVYALLSCLSFNFIDASMILWYRVLPVGLPGTRSKVSAAADCPTLYGLPLICLVWPYSYPHQPVPYLLCVVFAAQTYDAVNLQGCYSFRKHLVEQALLQMIGSRSMATCTVYVMQMAKLLWLLLVTT